MLNALIIAEELGVTQGNVEDMAMGTDHPEINRMLGSEGSYGEMLGLDPDWAVRAIAAEGNYAEIFDRYIGPDTPAGPATWVERAVQGWRHPLRTAVPVDRQAGLHHLAVAEDRS